MRGSQHRNVPDVRDHGNVCTHLIRPEFKSRVSEKDELEQEQSWIFSLEYWVTSARPCKLQGTGQGQDAEAKVQG